MYPYTKYTCVIEKKMQICNHLHNQEWQSYIATMINDLFQVRIFIFAIFFLQAKGTKGPL